MLSWLAKRSSKFIISSAMLYILLVSLLDGYTGYSFRVTFLYIFPILLVSWFENNKSFYLVLRKRQSFAGDHKSRNSLLEYLLLIVYFAPYFECYVDPED